VGSAKSEAIPVTGSAGPQCRETSRIPHFFYTIGSCMAVGFQPFALAALYSHRKISGTHFSGSVDPRVIMQLE
jgi:hypothetical protein